MITRFAPLFTLETRHGYYADSRCRDFAYAIPDATADELRRARLVAKVLDDRLHVLFEGDESGDPLFVADELVLRIGLSLTNPYFDNFTKPGFVPGSAIAVHDNRTDKDSLGQPVMATVSGPLLAHTLKRPDRPVTVEVKARPNIVVATESVTADPARAAVSFDLGGQRPGLYTVVETYDDATTTSSNYYVDPDFARDTVLVVVEVVVTKALYDSAPAFAVDFEARLEPLRYYVVVRNYSQADVANLVVTDAGADGRPAVQFDRVLPAAFSSQEIPRAMLALPDDDVILFRSKSPVRRLATGRQRLQLRRNGDVLVANLPQPGADRPGSDLVVHLTKPKT